LTGKQEIGSRLGVAEGIGWLAKGAALEGQPERAARLWGAATALQEALGRALTTNERGGLEEYQSAARAALGDEVFAAAFAAGEALTMEEAIAFALKP